jgi:alpha-L-fucosidase
MNKISASPGALRNLLSLLPLLSLLFSCKTVPPPDPFGALPGERQLAWHQMKYYAFIHFGPNTFTDVEWGHGTEDPKVFLPTQLDCRQWARTIRDAGMEGVVITAKHHDGFCLWPSQYSTHTVRESYWRNGQGDLLKELSEACREYGIKFGVYVSPWDRNHPKYGTPEYNDVYKKTLEEVLTQYGEVFEVWFDGANGEGPNGKKQTYDFPGFAEVVRKHQPMAVIFSDGGPDIRWVGNEAGYAAETNWCTVKKDYFYPGIPDVYDQLQTGHEDGGVWCPTEVNTSIRPGWFYHPAEDTAVKPLSRLIDNYYHSVGMNGNFLLNLPVDRRGLVHENDARRLMELKAYLDAAFAVNYARGAKATASSVRRKKYAAQKAVDKSPDTYWAAADEAKDAFLELDLNKPATFNAVLIQEYIALGQRIKSFRIEAWEGGTWREIGKGATVGNRRIVRVPAVTAQKIRIQFQGKACPVISNIEVYDTP